MVFPVKISNTEAIKNATNIKQISNILLPFNILYFSFSRIYNDGTRIYLSNSPEWMEVVNERFYMVSITNKPFSKYESVKLLWSQLGGLEILKAAKEHSTMGHGFIEIQKKEKYCDIYMYATDVNNIGFETFYLNNLDLLQNYQDYFLETAGSIIDKVQSDRSIFPRSIVEENLYSKPFHEKNSDDIIDPEKRKIFYKKINYINGISNSENECLIYLAHGMTAKEVAKILKISPRTVESHIQNMKIKLNCYNKSELINKFWAKKIHFIDKE